MNQIKLSKDVTLPIELTTRRSAIFGISGSGKSNTATVIIEQLLHAGEQIVLIDPKGEGWGLQTSADGKKEAFDIIVFGQPRGDIPELKEEHAEQIADFVVESGRSVVLSLLGFDSDQAERRFVTKFFQRLYRRKSQMPVKTRTLVVLEEAHLFIPEQATGAASEMVGAIKRIARQGRSAGLGLMLVDQRPQDVAKSVVTQSELLICHQLVHKLDREALRDWVKAYDKGGQGETFLSSLAGLQPGEPWVWSPAWLHLFQRTQVDRRTTYDSGATPDGSTPAAPKAKAVVDLDKLRTHLAKVVEEQKANDPAELKKRIKELEREAARPAAAAVVKSIDKPVITDQQIERLEKLQASIVEKVDAWWKRASDGINPLLELLNGQRDEVAKLLCAARAINIGAGAMAPSSRETKPAERASSTSTIATYARPRADDGVRTAGKRSPVERIVDALAWLESIGVDQPENGAVAFVAGYSPTSTGYTNPRGAARSEGLLEYLGGDLLRLTDAGRQMAVRPTLPPSLGELHQRILGKLPSPEQRILTPLLRAFPKVLSNADVAAAAGYSASSTGYTNPRGRLRTLGLVEYTGGGVKARDILFPKGLA